MKEVTDEVRVLREFHKFLDVFFVQFKDTDGNITAPELMGDVIIPYNWKEFVFCRGCSFNCNTMLEKGRIAGGRESKEEDKHTLHTSQLPFRENPDEEEASDDLSVPKKVHNHNNWKYDQDAVYWIKLSPNAIIIHNPVPADCIYCVISQKGDRTLFEKTLHVDLHQG